MKRKLKWNNIIETSIFLVVMLLILHDIYMVTIHGWITGNQATFTWLGLGSLFINMMLANIIYEDLECKVKETKKTVVGQRSI